MSGERFFLLISAEYISHATGVRRVNRDSFSINGKWKQKCYILPARGLMITDLSHIGDDSHVLLASMENTFWTSTNKQEGIP